MSRKSKYSKELKLTVVSRYLNGESATMLANEFNMGKSGRTRIYEWSNQYNANGASAFDNLPRNKSYSKEIKQMAINDYLSDAGSYEFIANKYNIPSHSILKRWVSLYNEGKEITDYNPMPEVYMTKSRKTTYDERVEIVKYCIDNNFDYKSAAAIYDTTYTQVFNWVKKYKEHGDEGLLDKRGKRKPETVLTDFEKLQRENEKLKRQLRYKDMEVEVLKKLEELSRREENKKLKK